MKILIKKNTLALIFLLAHHTFFAIKASAIEPATEEQLSAFFSLFPDPAKTFPALSELDDTVALFFNKTLGITGTNLSMIQRFYAYLKQEAIQDFIEQTSAKGSSKSLHDTFIEAQSQLAIATHHNDTQAITQWTATVNDLTTTLNQTLQTKLAPVLLTACMNTDSWQNHLKVFIANSFTYELQLLATINQDEIKMFSFLPQFETAYYSTQYTTLRTSADYVRTLIIITDILRSRALAQCNDWKTITDPAQLYDAIETFKEGDFYTFCQKYDILQTQKTVTPLQHQVVQQSSGKASIIAPGYRNYLTFEGSAIVPQKGMEALFSIENTTISLTPLGAFLLEEKMITPVKGTPYAGLTQTPYFFKLFEENQNDTGHLPTKLFLELVSFNALRVLGSLTNYLFNDENLSSTMKSLDTLQSNKLFNTALFPNFIFYQPEDELLLESINTLTKTLSLNPVKGATPAGFWSDLWHDIKGAFESMGHTFKTDFTKIGDDLWHTVQDAGDLFVHLAYSVEDVGIGLYYQTGIACLVQGISYSDASTDAGNYFDAAAQQIADAGNSCMYMVDNLTDVAQEIQNMANSVIAQTVGAIVDDPGLGSDLENCLDEVASIAIGAFRDSTDFLINVGTSMVKLTFEATMMLEEAAVGAIESVGSAMSGNYYSGGFNAFETTGQYFAKDLILSILQAATLLVTTFTDALKSLMVAIGYLTSAITDLIVDVAGIAAGLEAVVTGGNFFSADKALQTTMNAHRRLISSIVSLVLMTAITVATLGTGSALEIGIGAVMLVMGTGMMALSVIGANQQDMQAIYEKQSQEDFLETFSAYVQALPVAQNALQAATLAETSERLQEQGINGDRGLVYYQNYMNSTLNALRSAQGYMLSSIYDQLLTPDTQNYPKTQILYADAGYNYGIKTNRFDINPSQGFRVFNAGRGTFAQEIAAQPAPFNNGIAQNVTLASNALAQSLASQTSGTSQTVTTFPHFITQKDISACTTPLSVEVRWRIIYQTKGDFYIGIYLNKNYIDTGFLNAITNNFETFAQQSIPFANSISLQAFQNKWKSFDTFNRYLYNFDNKAKAFVCYQNDQTNNAPALGIYEHSDKQFILSNQTPTESRNWFARGAWYRMTATLSNQQLSVSFYKEDDQNVRWAQTAVVSELAQSEVIPYQTLMSQIQYHPQALYTGSYGIITSGAAVEYEILSPQQTITLSPDRTSANAQTQQLIQSFDSPTEESQREELWKKTFNAEVNPQYGSWKLIPFSSLTVAQGVYAYSTPSTKLPLPANLSDYVVSLQNPPGQNSAGAGQRLIGSGAQLGQPITSTTPYVISLVTGNCYNMQGQIQTTYPDALAAYQQQAKLPQQLVAAIQQAQQLYYKKEEGALSFQNVIVNGVDAALKSGIPLYSCISFTQYLSGLDYLIFVNVPTNGNPPGTPQSLEPLAPTNTITSALSLVTGTIFNLVSGPSQTQIAQLTPGSFATISLINSDGPAYTNMFGANYQANLNPQLAQAIQNQINAYNTTLTTPPIQPPAQTPTPPSAPTPTPPVVPGNSGCVSLACMLTNNSSYNPFGGF